jgi:hypothetical protein
MAFVLLIRHFAQNTATYVIKLNGLTAAKGLH